MPKTTRGTGTSPTPEPTQCLCGAQSGNRTHDLRITSEIRTVRAVPCGAISQGLCGCRVRMMSFCHARCRPISWMTRGRPISASSQPASALSAGSNRDTAAGSGSASVIDCVTQSHSSVHVSPAPSALRVLAATEATPSFASTSISTRRPPFRTHAPRWIRRDNRDSSAIRRQLDHAPMNSRPVVVADASRQAGNQRPAADYSHVCQDLVANGSTPDVPPSTRRLDRSPRRPITS